MLSNLNQRKQKNRAAPRPTNSDHQQITQSTSRAISVKAQLPPTYVWSGCWI